MQLCPVCAGQSRPTATLRAEQIRARLAEDFGEPVPDSVTWPDYELRECGACTLVFAHPMRAGGAPFYRWVTSFPAYHADARWEWGALRRILLARKSARLLELGCGEGKFLASIADLKHVEAIGIDSSDADVARARGRGLNVRLAPLEDVLGGNERFDVIVMSHVLEHVESPLSVIENCRRLLEPGGEIIFSVPYSPTSREYLRLDVMNLPPHHLTRWNLTSLRRLADTSGLAFAHAMRKPKPLLKRAIRHAVEAVNGPRKVGTLRGIATVLSHPGLFRDALRLHRAREKIDGRRAADEILVRLQS